MGFLFPDPKVKLSEMFYYICSKYLQSMEFVALDFETANARRDSACALGVVKVVDGQVVDSRYWLIRPPDLYFAPMHVAIHGITASDVFYEPTFDDLFAEIQPYISDTLLLAHNAAFDMGVLKAMLARYDIALPHSEYLCTVSLSRKLYSFLPNHKLNTMADYLKMEFRHHNALDDSKVCAKIALDACQQNGFDNLYELASSFHINIKRLIS